MLACIIKWPAISTVSLASSVLISLVITSEIATDKSFSASTTLFNKSCLVKIPCNRLDSSITRIDPIRISSMVIKASRNVVCGKTDTGSRVTNDSSVFWCSCVSAALAAKCWRKSSCDLCRIVWKLPFK